MITLEIAFETGNQDLCLTAPGIGFEVDASMKSDRGPSSLREDEIFSRLSGRVIHIFDKKFVGLKAGYRALYDDIIDMGDWFKFKSAHERSFMDLLDASMEASGEGKLFVCSDMQFGPYPKRYNTMSRSSFCSNYRRFGIRINSCIEVMA
jgi:hypothetical protein